MTEPAITDLNTMERETARVRMLECCGSTRWAQQMANARPFQNHEALFSTATREWGRLAEPDFLEAFGAHPKIGDLDSLRSRFSADAWAGDEQSGAAAASGAVLERLAEGNRLYEERFGFIFIVCATAKSGGEMLALLEVRLPNTRPQEISEAARQQALITRIRLEKLLATLGRTEG
ncbi:MAG: 2-oxo-4-hydroxy-4-carboxy-5-ureidoimidazoline decarboxylase [Rhodothermales bacterium]|jgi:2-oxo-4-hydroxy-4-carboxy-5-ureidoimidazoline decarboxylase